MTVIKSRLVSEIEHRALAITLDVLRRKEQRHAQLGSDTRYQELHTIIVIRLSELLNEVDDAVRRGTVLIWALSGSAVTTTPRRVELEALVLERIKAEISEAVEFYWAQGAMLLSRETRSDALSHDQARLKADLEIAEAEGKVVIERSARRAGAEHLTAATKRVHRCLLDALANDRRADLSEVGNLLARTAGGSWTPVSVLRAIADLRAEGEGLTSGELELISTVEIVRRAASVPQARTRWTLLGLRTLSEHDWTLLECCESAGNSPEEVCARFERATGIALPRDQTIARATWIRARVLIPVAAAAGVATADDADVLAGQIAATLPDADHWERSASYRAEALNRAMWDAHAERPGPNGLEKRGNVALLAGVRARLSPNEACDFATEVDPTFRRPELNEKEGGASVAYRRRLSDVRSRQPALLAFFPAHEGRVRRTDAVSV